MKTEGWGNGGAVEIQRLTVTEFLPQLTQDAFFLGDRYAETPGNMPDFMLRTFRSRATEIHFLTPMNSRERG
jgi:hypothetical protein